MRIGVGTWGSEGDVRPFIALSEGLARAGHDVTLVYASADDRDYAPRLLGTGFRHRRAGSLGLSREELNRVAREVFSDTDPLRQMGKVVRHLLDPLLEDLLRSATELAQECDLVVFHPMAHPFPTAAQKAATPTMGLYPGPLVPSRTYPPPGAPDLGALNGLAWKLALWMLDRKLRPGVQRLRAIAGLPPVRSLAQLLGTSALDLLAVSPALFPAAPDWPAKVKVVGFLDPARPPDPEVAFQAPTGLEEFLARAAAPVFVTFGSMTGVEAQPAAVLRTVQEAVALAGCRAVVQTEVGVDAVPESADVFRIGAVPHELLFPRCAAIVHHGGAGTTHSAARSGRPSVVVAHMADQPFWGKLLHARGVAPPHLTRRTLRADPLARAIAQAVGDPGMAARAGELGRRMRAEDGVAAAVRVIEEHSVGPISERSPASASGRG